MMMRLIGIWLCQGVLFFIGIGVTMLCAEFGSALALWAFGIDELIPKVAIFFGMATLIAFVGNRFRPEQWMGNPLL